MNDTPKNEIVVPRMLIIIKGDRRRQCAEADFAHFAARGFEKAAVPVAQPMEPTESAPAAPSVPDGKSKAKKS